MFNLPKKTEINKMENFVLAIAQFCAEMTIQKRLYFSQINIVGSNKNENGEEIKTYSLKIIFLTFSKEEKIELMENGFKSHPKINGEIILKWKKDGKLSLEKVDINATVDLKEKTFSSFMYSDDPRLTESMKYAAWISEEQKNDFADFVSSFANYI